jgi:hypothetical protein
MLLALLQQQDMSGTGESLLDNGTKHISEFVLFNFALTWSSCCQKKTAVASIGGQAHAHCVHTKHTMHTFQQWQNHQK